MISPPPKLTQSITLSNTFIKSDQKYTFFHQLNKFRSSPLSYSIDDLNKISKAFVSQNQIYTEKYKKKTQQGRVQWINTIEYLKEGFGGFGDNALPSLQWSQSLYLAAKHISKHIIIDKISPYFTQNQTLPFLQKYLQKPYKDKIKSLIVWIPYLPKYAILECLVSDGDKNREKRQALLDSSKKYAASYSSVHPILGEFIVFILSDEASSKKKDKLTAGKLINQINKLRSNPQSFIPDLKSHLLLFHKNKYIKYSEQLIIKTHQGKKPWIEAIQWLKTEPASPQLLYNKDLNKLALKKSKYQHMQFSKFIQKFSNIKGKAKFIQSYGTCSPRLIVINLIISDGDITRSSRKIITSPQYQVAGGFVDVAKGHQGCGLLLIQKQKQGVLGTIQRLQRQLSLKSIQSIQDLRQYINKKSGSKKQISGLDQLKKNIPLRLKRSASQNNTNALPSLNNYMKYNQDQNNQQTNTITSLKNLQMQTSHSQRRKVRRYTFQQDAPNEFGLVNNQNNQLPQIKLSQKIKQLKELASIKKKRKKSILINEQNYGERLTRSVGKAIYNPQSANYTELKSVQSKIGMPSTMPSTMSFGKSNQSRLINNFGLQ